MAYANVNSFHWYTSNVNWYTSSEPQKQYKELSDMDLVGLTNEIVVYQKPKELTPEQKDRIGFAHHVVNMHASDLFNTTKRAKAFTKYVGKKAMDALEALYTLSEENREGVAPKKDIKATNALRKEYTKLVDEYIEKKNKLVKVENEVADVQEYIDMCEKVASIGSKMTNKK